MLLSCWSSTCSRFLLSSTICVRMFVCAPPSHGLYTSFSLQATVDHLNWPSRVLVDGSGVQWMTSRSDHFPCQRPLSQGLMFWEHSSHERHCAVYRVPEIAWLRQYPQFLLNLRTCKTCNETVHEKYRPIWINTRICSIEQLLNANGIILYRHILSLRKAIEQFHCNNSVACGIENFIETHKELLQISHTDLLRNILCHFSSFSSKKVEGNLASARLSRLEQINSRQELREEIGLCLDL